MTKPGWSGIAISALLAGCVALLPPEPELPDLRRGQLEAEYGDLAAAEFDLLPLAEEGYLTAQRELAKVYAQLGTPDALKKAAHWYRKAAEQDPSVAVALARVLVQVGSEAEIEEAGQFLRLADDRGDPRALAALIELYTEHPERDPKRAVGKLVERAARVGDPETEGAVIRWYRAQAPAEPRYATALVRHCMKARGAVPECYVDLARHYRQLEDTAKLKELLADAKQQYAAGQLPSRVLERTAWSLVSESIEAPAQPELAYPLLKQLGSGRSEAQVRLARLLVEYPELDPDGDPEALLLSAVKQGSADAALALGRLYMNGRRVPANPQLAEKYLLQAASTLAAAHYFLGRIYKRGDLGSADPVRAAEHLLLAARGGYPKGDVALAQLFSDNRGVRVNRVNALMFATIATRNGLPEGQELTAQLRPVMTSQEVSRANSLLQKELAVRRTAPALGALQGERPPEESP